jgi:hypothetical protein
LMNLGQRDKPSRAPLGAIPSAIPSPRSMAGPQRRLQASGVAHPPRPERNQQSFGEDLDANAARTDRQDRKEPRCGAGRQIPTGRRPRMLPRQSALMPQPCRRGAYMARRTLPQTRGARWSCALWPVSFVKRPRAERHRSVNLPQTAGLQREHPNESLRRPWPRSHHISFCMPPRRRHTA